jgi:hypothetical protein
MMGASWESLLRSLVEVRDGLYRSEPDRDEARRDNLEWIVQAMLEKLRDEAASRDPAMSDSQIETDTVGELINAAMFQLSKLAGEARESGDMPTMYAVNRAWWELSHARDLRQARAAIA